MLRFIESVLGKPAHFYDTLRSELHGVTGVDITSIEPTKSGFSCFDHSYKEGSDWAVADGPDTRYIWKECSLVVDDDGLHWKSRSGKKGKLLIYAIRRVELERKYIKIWVEPLGSCDQMGSVEFRK